jgi:RimJ/RimL family protein N-acetyltransferase
MLEGKLVRLRAYEPSDAERAWRWMNDREVTRTLTMRYPVSLVEEERWVTGRPQNGFSDGVRLAIETKAGQHIGSIALQAPSAEDRHATLGIAIGEKPYWSRGYGRDAIVTLLRFGFGEMNLHRVSLHVFEFNERAMACYRACGFVEEGRLRDHYYTEGRYWDSVVMGVLRHEFEALYGEGDDA